MTRLSKEGLVYLLREECNKAGGVEAWASENNCWPKNVANIVGGYCNFSADNSPDILRALGYREVTSYVPIGSAESEESPAQRLVLAGDEHE